MYILDDDVINLINGTSHEKKGVEQEGQRRSLKDGMKCLKGFSLDEKPPSFPIVQGFTIPICQFDPETSKVYEFATFFDESLGIPRYAVYKLTPTQVDNFKTFKRPS